MRPSGPRSGGYPAFGSRRQAQGRPIGGSIADSIYDKGAAMANDWPRAAAIATGVWRADGNRAVCGCLENPL